MPILTQPPAQPTQLSALPTRESVGYGVLLQAIVSRLGGAPPPRRLLLCALGLLLEVRWRGGLPDLAAGLPGLQPCSCWEGRGGA